jgi:hypothetical protein
MEERQVQFFYFVLDATRDVTLHDGEVKQRWSVIYYLELLRASVGTLSRWSRLHLQSLAPTNPPWARVVGYGPFSLWVIHKEGLYPSSGDINKLMMMMDPATRTAIYDDLMSVK